MWIVVYRTYFQNCTFIYFFKSLAAIMKILYNLDDKSSAFTDKIK